MYINIFIVISRLIYLALENVSDKSRRENEDTIHAIYPPPTLPEVMAFIITKHTTEPNGQ